MHRVTVDLAVGRFNWREHVYANLQPTRFQSQTLAQFRAGVADAGTKLGQRWDN